MPSTPLAYPQVDRGGFASFRVVESSISAVHAVFCAWFDSRQLHQSKLVRAKALASFLFHRHLMRGCWSRRTYEGRDRAGADDDAALALKEFGLFQPVSR
jgi:hypothetical protein